MDILIAAALTLTAADPALAGAPPPPGAERVYGDERLARRSRSRAARAGSGVHAAPAHPVPPLVRHGRTHVETASGYRSGESTASRRRARTGEIVSARNTIESDPAVTASRAAPAGAARRTVTLGADFFLGGLTGGVERPAAPVYYGYGYYGRGVVVITGPRAPRSAGQAAAALGLPRG